MPIAKVTGGAATWSRAHPFLKNAIALASVFLRLGLTGCVGCSFPELQYVESGSDATTPADDTTSFVDASADESHVDPSPDSQIADLASDGPAEIKPGEDAPSESTNDAALDVGDAGGEASPLFNYRLDYTNLKPLPEEGISYAGTAFSLQCPTGSLAVGVSGNLANLGGSPIIGAIGLSCAKLNSDGKLGAIAALKPTGPTSGPAFASGCPGGAVLVELHGTTDFQLYQLGIGCAPLDAWLASGSGRTKLPVNGAASPGFATPYDDICPSGYAIDAFVGHTETTHINSVSARCVRMLR
ncbi:MAG: hypothetical protein NVS3B20_13840 [Polyangiales bacterium]